eukprot:755397_1
MAQSSIRKYCACGVIVGFQNIIVDPGSTAQQKGERLNLRQCEIHDDRKHRLVLLAAGTTAASNSPSLSETIDEANKTPLMFTVNDWFSPPGIVEIPQDVSTVIFAYLNDPQDLHRYSTEFVPEMSVLFDKDACKTNIDFFKCWLDDIPSTIMERYAILHEDEEKEEDEDEEEEEDDFEDRRDTRLCLIKTKIQSPFASEIRRIAGEYRCRGYIRLVEAAKTSAIFAIVIQSDVVNVEAFHRILCQRFSHCEIKIYPITFGRLFKEFMVLSVIPPPSSESPRLSIFDVRQKASHLGHRHLYHFPITFSQMSDLHSTLSETERLHIDGSYHGTYVRVIDPLKREEIEISLNTLYANMFDRSEDGLLL